MFLPCNRRTYTRVRACVRAMKSSARDDDDDDDDVNDDGVGLPSFYFIFVLALSPPFYRPTVQRLPLSPPFSSTFVNVLCPNVVTT